MRVEVLTEGTTLEVESDEDGRFVLEPVPKGLVKLALHPAGRTVLSPTIAPWPLRARVTSKNHP